MEIQAAGQRELCHERQTQSMLTIYILAKTITTLIAHGKSVVNITYSLFRMNAITLLKSLFPGMMRWCLSVEQMHLILCADTIG